MANQSTLRPSLSSLLRKYLQLFTSSPRTVRLLGVPLILAIFGSVYRWRKRVRTIEEKKGRTLVRRNSEVKLTDGTLFPRRGIASIIFDTIQVHE